MIRTWLFVGRLLILLVVGVFVFACESAQSTSSPTPSSRPRSNPLIIGAPLAITGVHSVEGNLTKNGYDLWADEVNKAGGIRIGRQRRMVQIKYYVDESDAQKSAQFAERLILEENVGLLLWPYGTVATDQVAEIAERNGAAESIFNHGYEYTFGVVSPAKQFAVAMIDLAVHQNPRPESIAIVFANDPFSLEVAEGAKAFAESLGVTVSVYERYQPNTPQLSGVVTLAKITGAEMLYPGWTSSPSMVGSGLIIVVLTSTNRWWFNKFRMANL